MVSIAERYGDKAVRGDLEIVRTGRVAQSFDEGVYRFLIALTERKIQNQVQAKASGRCRAFNAASGTTVSVSIDTLPGSRLQFSP